MMELKIVIVGGGKTGQYLAEALKKQDIELILIDKDRSVVERLIEKGLKAFHADACDPSQLERTGIQNADVAAVVTGHDEDNLVISNLLKKVFLVKRVVAKINHPMNEWIFTDDWGVDIGVSSTHIIADLLIEEMQLKKAVEILKIRHGTVAVIETTIDTGSSLANRKVSELNLPANSLIVAVIRDGKIFVPDGEFVLLSGDEILAVTSSENEGRLIEVLES